MPFMLFVTSFFIFIGTINYSIYEIKKIHNIFGGICVIIIAVIGLFLPGIMSILR